MRSVVFILIGLSAVSAFGDAPATTTAGVSASAPRFVLEWGKRGSAPGEFNFPIGIAIDSDATLFITDFYNARVQHFDGDGKLLSAFPTLPNPGALSMDKDNNLYITHFPAMQKTDEPKPDRIVVYTRTGEILRQFGRTGKGNGEMDFAGGTAISPDGRIYLADATNHRVEVFDMQGKYLFQWGKYGSANGEFGGGASEKGRVGGPQFVALDKEGNVFTTEGRLGRVQKFTHDGKSLLSWGSAEDKPGALGGAYHGMTGASGPIDIIFDPQGNVWISAASGRVQQFTAEGKFLRSLQPEDEKEPRRLTVPHGIALDGKGNLFVVDSFAHRVQKYAVGP